MTLQPPLPPPREKSNHMRYEDLLAQTISNPERNAVTRNIPRRTKQTTAAAITKSSTPTSHIRNVNVLITTPEDYNRIANQIRNDELSLSSKLNSIKQRGALSFTITTTTEQGAFQLERWLIAKHEGRIEVSKVESTRPLVKITRLEHIQRPTREILAQIFVQTSTCNVNMAIWFTCATQSNKGTENKIE